MCVRLTLSLSLCLCPSLALAQDGSGAANGERWSRTRIFTTWDKNGDGKLDRNELPGALFDRLDANKDGFVTENELKALWKSKQ